MTSEADYLINRHKNCGDGCGHSHGHSTSHEDHIEHTLHKGSKEAQSHRNFQQMDQPKVQIEKFIYAMIFIHLPLSYVICSLQDSFSDETRRMNFLEKLENLPSPFEGKRIWIQLVKTYLINFFDLMVVLYLFRPIAKLDKQVRISDFCLRTQEKESLNKIQVDYVNLQKKTKHSQASATEEEVQDIIKRRSTIAKVLTKKRQSYNLITSEYVTFCFSMNTILTTFCFLMNIANYVSSKICCLMKKYVFVPKKLYAVGFLVENQIMSALFLRMVLFIVT